MMAQEYNCSKLSKHAQLIFIECKLRGTWKSAVYYKNIRGLTILLLLCKNVLYKTSAIGLVIYVGFCIGKSVVGEVSVVDCRKSKFLNLFFYLVKYK